jgi:hypothetical protein
MTTKPVNAICVGVEYKPLNMNCPGSGTVTGQRQHKLTSDLEANKHIDLIDLFTEIQMNMLTLNSHQGNCRNPLKLTDDFCSPGQAVNDPEDPGPAEVTQLLVTSPPPHPSGLIPLEHDTRGQVIELAGVGGEKVKLKLNSMNSVTV